MELLLAGIVCGVDQVIKHRIDAAPENEPERPAAGGKVIVTHYHNEGAVLGFLGDRKVLLNLFSGAAAAGIVFSLVRAIAEKQSAVRRIGLSLAAGGAASNMYDRLAHGSVTDYFRLTFLGSRIKNVIFNLADMAIFAGAALELAVNLKRSVSSSESEE